MRLGNHDLYCPQPRAVVAAAVATVTLALGGVAVDALPAGATKMNVVSTHAPGTKMNVGASGNTKMN